MDKETLAKLDACCEREKTNRSEFVRRSIQEKYDDLKKWKEAASSPKEQPLPPHPQLSKGLLQCK